MRQIAFIGAGGIGSFAVENLFNLGKQLSEKGDFLVKIFDNDIVEEKNVRYNNQNYKIEHLMEQKCKIMAERYNSLYEEVFITKDNLHLLDVFDDIILCVDNNKVRQLVYEYCLKKNKYLLDLRAQGTMISYYVLDHEKDMKYYNEKMFSNKELMEQKGSCQLPFDVENNNFQNGNKIIAFFGICGIYLKHIREEELSTNEFKFAY